MNENLYNYLLENNFLTHGIGEINDKETYFKFESIIKTGGLMSLQQLKEKGINVHGKAYVSNYDSRTTSENQISFFDPTLPEFKDRLLSKRYYYYLPFNPNVIFFIIDRTNIDLTQHKTKPFELDTNVGFCSIDNFKGIIAPSECAEYLNNIQKKYDICLPIYDFDFNITNDLNDINHKKI